MHLVLLIALPTALITSGPGLTKQVLHIYRVSQKKRHLVLKAQKYVKNGRNTSRVCFRILRDVVFLMGTELWAFKIGRGFLGHPVGIQTAES